MPNFPNWFAFYTGKLTEYQYGVVLGVLFLVCITLIWISLAQRRQLDAEEYRYEQIATYLCLLVVLAGVLYFSLGWNWGVMADPAEDRKPALTKAITGLIVTALTMTVILYKQWAKFQHKYKHHHHEANDVVTRGSTFKCPAPRHTEKKSISVSTSK